MAKHGIALHPRRLIVASAETALTSAVLEWMKVEGVKLTDGEVLSVLNEVFSKMIQHEARSMIRMERHGTTDKKGDEA